MRLLIAIAALAASVSVGAGGASGVKENWVVKEWTDGFPKTAVYSDNNMTISLIAQEILPREGGGWKVDFVTAEIYSSQNLLGKTEGRSRQRSLNILGWLTRSWHSEVQHINSRELVVKDIPVPSLWCDFPVGFTQYTPSEAIHVSFPIQEIESMEYHKLLEQWRDSSPILRKNRRQYIPSAASKMDESDLATLSEEQRSQEGMWYQPESCTQAYEGYLERERQKAAEEQAQQDYVDGLIDDANSQGDVMLVTNQKLLECKLEPECESQVLGEMSAKKRPKADTWRVVSGQLSHLSEKHQNG